jgi:hypothetical protein
MVRLAQALGGDSVGRVRVEKGKVNEEDLARYWPNFKTILADGAILVFRFESVSGENFQAFIGVRSFNNALKIVLVDD